MLSLLLLLTGLSRLRADTDSERLHVQITVPEKIRSKTTGEIESEVSYNIPIEGKTYTVNLIQKTFLPSTFRVYGYTDTGSMKPLDQQYQNFCYYQGYIEGYPNSVALVSACTGLRGLLQFENVSYGIEPLESSIGFEHVIYQVKHKNASVSLYAEKEFESRDLPHEIQSVNDIDTVIKARTLNDPLKSFKTVFGCTRTVTKPLSDFSYYIEMHIVIEKHLYNHMGSDPAVVTQKVFQLIGLTSAIFASVNITVILSSLELWIDENKILTTGDANEILHRFLKWKRSYLVLRPHDVAFLLVYREHSNYVGATFQGKMCDRNYGGGVAMHPRAMSLESLTVILAQLLCLSMGITYDDLNKCHCSGTVCLMNPEAIHFSGVKMFSNCSLEDFAHFISKPESQCLQNQPRLDLSYKIAVCGNAVVEEGEQCDCGTPQTCDTPEGRCCNRETCTLTAESNCITGDCCQECVYKAKGVQCRSAADECDLAEYCNGSSASCQEDFFIQNGHPCGQNQWLCLEGKCASGIKQCTETFGEGASFGTQACFAGLNSRTDQSGNCGSGPLGYTRCQPTDYQCGKLVCTYEKDTLVRFVNATTIYANIEGQICIALEFKHDHKDSQLMWVKEGTVCGQNKVCKNMRCVDSSYLGYDCTAEKCSNQGVCNNRKHCHCNPAYLPPNCRTELESWGGGSIDSGNFPPDVQATPPNMPAGVGRSYIERTYGDKFAKWQFYLLIPFFIILGVLIAILVKFNFQREKWRHEEYTSDEQFESDSEPEESLHKENP